MNKNIWLTLVALVILVVITSFFWLFREQQTEPEFLHLPYILWLGILQTTLLVILTYLGAKYFPYKDVQKP